MYNGLKNTGKVTFPCWIWPKICWLVQYRSMNDIHRIDSRSKFEEILFQKGIFEKNQINRFKSKKSDLNKKIWFFDFFNKNHQFSQPCSVALYMVKHRLPNYSFADLMNLVAESGSEDVKKYMSNLPKMPLTWAIIVLRRFLKSWMNLLKILSWRPLLESTLLYL